MGNLVDFFCCFRFFVSTFGVFLENNFKQKKTHLSVGSFLGKLLTFKKYILSNQQCFLEMFALNIVIKVRIHSRISIMGRLIPF